MSKRVSVRILTYFGWETVFGVRVKVGVIEDLFAATNRAACGGRTIKGLWDITHIPSGFCYTSGARSPSKAAKKFEKAVKEIGRERYEAAIASAMQKSKS